VIGSIYSQNVALEMVILKAILPVITEYDTENYNRAK
jgi:hypothetical protein